jgi:hypothetical protein
VPSPNNGFVAVAGGGRHSLGIRSGGSIVAWGNNTSRQCNVPTPNAGFVAVAGGDGHSLGLKSDGSIVAWGSNTYGQCDVPAPNMGFVAIAAGYEHSLGLRSDGSIAAWGRNNYGQCNVPAPNTGFAAVAAGDNHSLGLKTDGLAAAWGTNYAGQLDLQFSGGRFVGIAAGGSVSYALTRVVTGLPGGEIAAPWLSLDIRPNPFNPQTMFSYRIDRPGHVTLRIYDLRGARVATLVDADQPVGEQSVKWNGTNDRGASVPSGVYLARLETGPGVRVVKVTLAR